MKIAYISTFLLFVIVANVGATTKRHAKSNPSSRNGFINFNTRPRFQSRFGDESSKLNDDYTALFRQNDDRKIRTLNNRRRGVLDTEEALLETNDQRPKGRRPYHVRRRYFGGKKRSEEGTSKRYASTLRLRSINNDNKLKDIHENNVRAIRHDNRFNKINDITYNNLQMRDDLSKLSNAELNDVLVDATNGEGLDAAMAARSNGDNDVYEDKEYLDLTSNINDARKVGRIVQDEDFNDAELGELLEE